MLDLTRVRWRKSSDSGNGNNCVEVGYDGTTFGVRDSKDPHGPILEFSPRQWKQFTRVFRGPRATDRACSLELSKHERQHRNR